MTTLTKTVRVSTEGVTLSLMIWRQFRASMPGVLEQALTLNPGIASLGPYLPVGTVVVLPLPQKVVATKPVVRLWD